MARVTVEDCIQRVPNRFELVLMTAGRAKALCAGAPLTIGRDNDKNTIVALREIEEDTLDLNVLRDNVISNMQKYAKPVEAIVDSQELREVDAELAGETLYADTEFVASENFQVVDATEA